MPTDPQRCVRCQPHYGAELTFCQACGPTSVPLRVVSCRKSVLNSTEIPANLGLNPSPHTPTGLSRAGAGKQPLVLKACESCPPGGISRLIRVNVPTSTQLLFLLKIFCPVPTLPRTENRGTLQILFSFVSSDHSICK